MRLLRVPVDLLLVSLSWLPRDIPVVILWMRTGINRMTPIPGFRHSRQHSCNPMTSRDPTLVPPVQLLPVNHHYRCERS